MHVWVVWMETSVHQIAYYIYICLILYYTYYLCLFLLIWNIFTELFSFFITVQSGYHFSIIRLPVWNVKNWIQLILGQTQVCSGKCWKYHMPERTVWIWLHFLSTFFVPRNIELNVETHSSSCIEGVLEF